MWAKFAIIECAIGKGKKPNSADALTDEEIEEFYYLSPWELTYNYYYKHENKHNLFKFLYQHLQNGH